MVPAFLYGTERAGLEFGSEVDWYVFYSSISRVDAAASGRSARRGRPVVGGKIISTSVLQSYVCDGPLDQVWMMISVVACGDCVGSLQLQSFNNAR